MTFVERGRATGTSRRLHSSSRADRTNVEPLPWSGPSASVHVTLDGSLVAHLRVLGIEPGVPPRASLMKQIPRLVERDLEVPQPLHVLFRGFAPRLLLEQLVLFRSELVDLIQERLVFHGPTSFDDQPYRPHAGDRALKPSLLESRQFAIDLRILEPGHEPV